MAVAAGVRQPLDQQPADPLGEPGAVGGGGLVGPLDLPGARSILRPAETDLFRQGAEEAWNEGYRAGFDESQAEGPLDTGSISIE